MNVRLYGKKPYRVAVIHGGPGAPGSVAAVARELSKEHGVLEPIQTRTSVEGQVLELWGTLQEHGTPPITLIGHSWGAWLAFLTAAKYPSMVRKLILVGSGPFAESYVQQLSATRLARLREDEQVAFRQLLNDLPVSGGPAKEKLMAKLEALVSKTDDYDPMIIETDSRDRIKVDADMYQAVWNEAAQLRRSGQLLAYANAIACPVVAIHGTHDPHPAEGVKKPLAGILKSFTFIPLEKCGHSPWKERHARDAFYTLLREELEP